MIGQISLISPGRLCSVTKLYLNIILSQIIQNFISNHSEKIIEILEVTKVGLDVFDNMDKLRLWFNTPNYALGNLRPIELLKDSYGKELVIGELIRINHGILV